MGCETAFFQCLAPEFNKIGKSAEAINVFFFLLSFFSFSSFSRCADGLSRTSRIGRTNIVHLLSPAVQRHRCTAEIFLVSPPFLFKVYKFDIAEERRTVLCALLETHRIAGARYEAGKFANAYGHSVFGTKFEYAEYEAKGAGQTTVGGKSAAATAGNCLKLTIQFRTTVQPKLADWIQIS